MTKRETLRGKWIPTHGMSGTRQYRIRDTMISRCYRPTHTAYKRYGEKWVRVCDTRKTFDWFRKDMAEGYKDGLTIDRIDNEEWYSPSNCKRSTMG